MLVSAPFNSCPLFYNSLGSSSASSGTTGDGGPATSALLYGPAPVHGDTLGGVYIGDNYKVRYIDSNAIISTFAGKGTAGYSGEGLPATSSAMYNPLGLALDLDNGDLYVANQVAYRVQLVNASTGLVTTYAGNGTKGTYGPDGSTPTSIELSDPVGVFLNTIGDLYIAESGVNNQGSNIVRIVKTVAVSIATALTFSPSALPTILPTTPSVKPTLIPTTDPSFGPTVVPSLPPTALPTVEPTLAPTGGPSIAPSMRPSVTPTVNTRSPTRSPSLRPSRGPSSIFPTEAPSVSGWVTRYRHYGPGCDYDSVVGLTAYKTNVCLPYINHFGNTTSKSGYDFGATMFACKDGK